MMISPYWVVLSINIESLCKYKAQCMDFGKLNKCKLVIGAEIVVVLILLAVEMRDPKLMPKKVKNCPSWLQGPLSADRSVVVSEEGKEGTSPAHRTFAKHVERSILLVFCAF